MLAELSCPGLQERLEEQQLTGDLGCTTSTLQGLLGTTQGQLVGEQTKVEQLQEQPGRVVSSYLHRATHRGRCSGARDLGRAGVALCPVSLTCLCLQEDGSGPKEGTSV